MAAKLRIAIIGGGPSGLFMFKRLVESGREDFSVTIFERKNKLGPGMPYSAEGANDEHITNVSGNEIPELVTTLHDWVKKVPKDTLDKYHMDPEHFNAYKVLPRLLFGQYLAEQFGLLQMQAKERQIDFDIRYNSEVTDIVDQQDTVLVKTEGQDFEYDRVVICSGHNWPKTHEDKVPGFFDSPYPPSKLALQLNHRVGIKGSSLTAVDAIRTLSRHNGTFDKDKNGKLFYTLLDTSPDFKMVMHTRNGMLPAVRFHLDDPHLSNDELLNEDDIARHIKQNDGFLSLDFVFEHDFKLPIKIKEPEFYEKIKGMNLEAFVDSMMQMRENAGPFELLKTEYAEAEKSIKARRSVYWKEMLGVLSFALNYPAKHLSAEDMQRLQKTLAPLISIVIAYIPQSSSEELLALHEAGVLDLIPVGEDSTVEANQAGGATYYWDGQSAHYQTYVDCVGQPHLSYEDLPFKSLLEKRTVSPAKIKFRYSDDYLKVPGIAINDNFQVVDAYGAFNERIYMMAVPYIGGFNPDYSGLDFGEEASLRIMERLFL